MLTSSPSKHELEWPLLALSHIALHFPISACLAMEIFKRIVHYTIAKPLVVCLYERA